MSCKKDGSALLENAICLKVPRLAKYQVLENSVTMWIEGTNEMYSFKGATYTPLI